MSNYLFLYGTLLPHHAPNEIAPAVERLRLRGDGVVRGFLYDLGEYPGAVLDDSAGGYIHGTAFEVPEDEVFLRELDAYEDCDPKNEKSSLFVRILHPVKLATGETLQCWIYVYNRDLSGARIIPSGRYRK
jgi:gamma-glutamylcyclotransferase (GGCT)/AIG2-like uncharacterized protein YtfP